MKAIEAYDSAYPGSMHQREDGSFIRREDAESLAGALLALIKSGDRAAEDLHDALTEEKKDAARYRWLRDVGDATWRPFALREGYSAAQADAAIDAAMKTPNGDVTGLAPEKGDK